LENPGSALPGTPGCWICSPRQLNL